MTPEETRILLGEVAAIDNRKMTSETAQTWYQLLAGFSLTECREALATFRRNRPDDWLVPGHLAQIINRTPTAGHLPRCTHGVPIGAGCHDCTHPNPCPMCDLDPETPDAKRHHRAGWGIVYPGEPACLLGHPQDHAPHTNHTGRHCGHPEHHIPRTQQ